MRAFTLLEVVVGAALGIMVLTLLVQLLVPSLRLSARAGLQTELQEACYLALHQLSEDLVTTVPAGLAYVNNTTAGGPTVIGLQPVADADDQARLVFAPELLSYSWSPAEGRLRRHRWKPLPAVVGTLNGNSPTRLTSTQLLQLPSVTSQAFEGRTMAVGVSQFSLALPVGPPNIGCPLTVRLELQRQAASDRVDRFELIRTVMLRTP